MYVYIYIDEQNKWHQVGIEKNNKKKLKENHKETTKHGTKRCLRCFFLLCPSVSLFHNPPLSLRWAPMPLWELLRGCIAKAKRKWNMRINFISFLWFSLSSFVFRFVVFFFPLLHHFWHSFFFCFTLLLVSQWVLAFFLSLPTHTHTHHWELGIELKRSRRWNLEKGGVQVLRFHRSLSLLPVHRFVANAFH